MSAALKQTPSMSMVFRPKSRPAMIVGLNPDDKMASIKRFSRISGGSMESVIDSAFDPLDDCHGEKDLARLDELTEERILDELKLRSGHCPFET